MSLGALAGKVALITGASKGTHACYQELLAGPE